MYRIDWTRANPLGGAAPGGAPPVARNVWYLGFTSLFTDISSEMVSSVLPAYLVLSRGLSPLEFGAVDGIYEGAGAIVRWIGGSLSDRWRRYKLVAVVGYAVSTLSRIGLLLAGGRSALIATVLAADRAGKGLRTAPRDALIAQSSDPRSIGAAFGVHRALDAAGALLGPVVAFGILRLTPEAFDSIFVVSFCIGVVGLAIILLFVDTVPARGEDMRAAPTVAHAPFRMDAALKTTLVAASALSLVTIGDAFVYLVLQRHAGFSAATFPLFSLMTAAAYLIVAGPAGQLADRIGRRRVFMVGHLVLLVVYALLLVNGGGTAAAVACVLALGMYYGMTDGVLAAGTSAMLPPDHRGRGLAVMGAAVSVSRAVGSLAFGWVWSTWSMNVAVACFAVALTVSVPFASRSLGTLDRAAG